MGISSFTTMNRRSISGIEVRRKRSGRGRRGASILMRLPVGSSARYPSLAKHQVYITVYTVWLLTFYIWTNMGRINVCAVCISFKAKSVKKSKTIFFTAISLFKPSFESNFGYNFELGFG